MIYMLRLRIQHIYKWDN